MTDSKIADVNWQRCAKTNNVYAKLVIIAYLCICGTIGFGIDVLINMFWFGLKWRPAIMEMLYFQRENIYGMPAMLALGVLILGILYLCQRKVMLMGLNAYPVDNVKDLSDREKMILDLVQKTASAIGLEHKPDLYIAETPVLNAFVGGSTKKGTYVVLTKGLLSHLMPKQVQAVIVMQLCHLKLLDQRLVVAVTLVAHIPLIIFDAIYHRFIYGKDRNPEPNPIIELGYKGLRITRFLLPASSFLFRFVLSPDRIHFAQIMAVKLMKENQSLGQALIKIHEYQFDNMEFLGEKYSEMAGDEIRREAYLFDPADINKSQTFATPFSTHPTLEEQLNEIGISDYVPNYKHTNADVKVTIPK
jgi:heat shock protein HtpX